MSTKKSSCSLRELFMTGWGDACLPLHGDESLLGLGARLHPLGGAPGPEGTAGRHRHPDRVPHAGDTSLGIVLG